MLDYTLQLTPALRACLVSLTTPRATKVPAAKGRRSSQSPQHLLLLHVFTRPVESKLDGSLRRLPPPGEDRLRLPHGEWTAFRYITYPRSLRIERYASRTSCFPKCLGCVRSCGPDFGLCTRVPREGFAPPAYKHGFVVFTPMSSCSGGQKFLCNSH